MSDVERSMDELIEKARAVGVAEGTARALKIIEDALKNYSLAPSTEAGMGGAETLRSVAWRIGNDR